MARVMQHSAPAYFVIDRNHEVTRFSGAETGHYLEPSQGAASLNLFSIRAQIAETRSQGRGEPSARRWTYGHQ